MAYTAATLYQVGPGGNSPRMWVYGTTDDQSDVVAASYFSDGDLRGLSAGDIINVVNTTDYTSYTLNVTSVTAG